MSEWGKEILEGSLTKEELEALKSHIWEEGELNRFGYRDYKGGAFLLAGDDEEEVNSVLNYLTTFFHPSRRAVFVERVEKLKKNRDLPWIYIRVFKDKQDMEENQNTDWKTSDRKTMKDLILYAAKMKTDNIVATDIVDDDALILMSKLFEYGHFGGATINSPTLEETVKRLEEVSARSDGEKEAADLFQLLIQLEKSSDGGTKVVLKERDERKR